MATIRFECKKSKKNSAGEAPIYLRVTISNQRVYQATGIRVPPARWNDSREEIRKSRKKDDDAGQLNTRLQDLRGQVMRRIRDIENAGRQVTVRAVRNAINPDHQPTTNTSGYIAWMKRKNKLLQNTSYNYYKNRGTGILALETWLGGDIAFTQLSPDQVEEFYTWLRNDKKMAANTANRHISILKTFWNRAIEEGETTVPNPFVRIKMKREALIKHRLSNAELEAIIKLDLPDGSLIGQVRDVFLFQVYTAGMRFSDASLLTWEKVGADRIVYTMKKSKRVRSMPRTDPINRILDKYRPDTGVDPKNTVFPILKMRPDEFASDREASLQISKKNALFNKYLSKIRKKANIQKKLSTHVARHTFSDLARKSGWEVYDISKALGHSNLRTTQEYLEEMDQDRLDKKMRGLFK